MSDISTDSSNKKKGLGRGLGSLLGGGSVTESPLAKATQAIANSQAPSQAKPNPVQVAQPAKTTTVPSQLNTQVAPPVDPESKVWKVAIDKLSSGQFQPRKQFEKEPLQELAQSIKENGILQPIVARRTVSGKLEIVAGERRWRAAQLAGLHEVPVLLRTFNDKEALELAIVENIQREDLNPIEEADGYSRLITEFKLSQQQVAEKVGKDRATVANAIRLLSLPNEVKEMIAENTLSVGHAKVLLALPEPRKQIEYAKKVINEKVPVRKLEKMVQAIAKGVEQNDYPEVAPKGVSERLVEGLSEELQKALGTKVAIDYSNSKGKIVIHFYSDDELTNFVDRLKAGWQKQ